jgi:hypothetical protein
MVLRELGGDAVLCLGQPAHAWVSGQIARAWGNGLFAEPRPRDEVVLAASQHDLGMAEWDASPQLNPETGWPMSFLEMPVATHLRLWSAAPRLALTQARWVALLVSMHGAYLYGSRAAEPGVQEFLDDQRAFADAVRASLGVSEEEAARNQRLLASWDWMSLVLCRDDLPATIEFERPLRMERAGEGAVSITPWPFGADEVEIEGDARRLEGRFDDEEAMRDALRAAPWEPVELRLVPG